MRTGWVSFGQQPTNFASVTSSACRDAPEPICRLRHLPSYTGRPGTHSAESYRIWGLNPASCYLDVFDTRPPSPTRPSLLFVAGSFRAHARLPVRSCRHLPILLESPRDEHDVNSRLSAPVFGSYPRSPSRDFLRAPYRLSHNSVYLLPRNTACPIGSIKTPSSPLGPEDVIVHPALT